MVDLMGLGHLTGNRLSSAVARPAPDAVIERLCLLALEIIRDPIDVSDVELAGVWAVCWFSLAGRASASMKLIEAGMLELAVATLQQSSPTDWNTWGTATGILSGSICTLFWTLSTLEGLGVNKTQLLLDKGCVEIAISAMKVRTVPTPFWTRPANVFTRFRRLSSFAASAKSVTATIAASIAASRCWLRLISTLRRPSR